MKKALILTWEKFQDCELIWAYYKLQEEFEVDVAANKEPLIYGVNGVKIKVNVTFCPYRKEFYKNTKENWGGNDTFFGASPEWMASQYDLVLVVGGVISVEYARQCELFINTLQAFDRAGKVIASICHGAQYLIEAELTKGKNIAGYYSIKKDIENSGATYVRDVVVDGNIVTAPHYDFQTKWMLEVVKLVNERADTKKLDS